MAETDEKQEPAEVPSGNDEGQSVQQNQTTGEVSKDARMWAMFCHLGGLAGLLPISVAIGSVIAPLIIWQIKKQDSPFIDENGKEALNFQISISIYALICIPLFLVCVGPFLLGAVYIFNLVFLLIAAIKANNGESYRYPLTIRFVK
ncbi:MAG: DUF4870 domain-containing protein [Phycisphaerales bacterium]|jgi:hypothetical protein